MQVHWQRRVIRENPPDDHAPGYLCTTEVGNAKPDTTQIEEKIAEIQRAIGTMQYLSSGTLLKRTKVCGNPNCHCARDPAARHGPYYEWSYLKGGRLHHRTLTPKQAELMRLAIANYRKAKKLLRIWEAHTQRLIELTAPE